MDLYDVLVFITKKRNTIYRTERNGVVNFWRMDLYDIKHIPELVLSNETPLKYLRVEMDQVSVRYSFPLFRSFHRMNATPHECIERCIRMVIKENTTPPSSPPPLIILDDLIFNVDTFVVTQGLSNLGAVLRGVGNPNFTIVPVGTSKCLSHLNGGELLLDEKRLMREAYVWMFGDRVVLLNEGDCFDQKGKYVYYYCGKKIKYHGYCF